MPTIGEYLDSVAENVAAIRLELTRRLGEQVEPDIGLGGQLKALDDTVDGLLDQASEEEEG